MYMMSMFKLHLKLISVSFFSSAEERKSRSWKHTGTRTRIVSEQTLEKDGQTGGREEVRRILKTSNITSSQALELSRSYLYPRGSGQKVIGNEFFPQVLFPVFKTLQLSRVWNYIVQMIMQIQGEQNLVWVIKSMDKWSSPNNGFHSTMSCVIIDFCTEGSTNKLYLNDFCGRFIFNALIEIIKIELCDVLKLLTSLSRKKWQFYCSVNIFKLVEAVW